MERELLTIAEAAQRARVSRRTIYHWLERKKVEATKTAGGQWRIFADSLFVKAA